MSYRDDVVLLLARVARLRRRPRDAGVHRRAHRVDVAPRPELPRLEAVMLGRGESGGVHGLQLHRVLGERDARSAEVEQHRAPFHGDEDVRGLDVQVQQLVCMNLAQPVHQVREDAPDEPLGELVAVALDVELERAAAHVLHHHVAGLVGAEEILDADHVGVRDHRQRPPLLEEALEAVAEDGLVGLFAEHHFHSVGAQLQRRRQVFLDRERRVLLVAREIDDAEPARRKRLLDAIAVQHVAGGQRLIRLCGHLVGGASDIIRPNCRHSPAPCKGEFLLPRPAKK